MEASGVDSSEMMMIEIYLIIVCLSVCSATKNINGFPENYLLDDPFEVKQYIQPTP